MTEADYEYYDLIVVMDKNNLRNIRRAAGDDPKGKISMLMDYTDRPGEVADPWYTGDFERTYKDIYEGCLGLLEVLKNEKM